MLTLLDEDIDLAVPRVDTPRHAHKRSTNSQGKSFRMTAEGSDFRCAFNWPGSSGDLKEAP